MGWLVREFGPGLLVRAVIVFAVSCMAIAIELALQNTEITACVAESASDAACLSAHRSYSRAVAIGVGVAILFVPFLWRGTNHDRQRGGGFSAVSSESAQLRWVRHTGVLAAIVGFGLLPVWVALGTAGVLAGVSGVVVIGAVATYELLRRRSASPDGTGDDGAGHR